MAEKRVSVRLSARGGDAVKRTFKDIGETGKRGFASVRSEMARTEKTVDRLAKRMQRFAAVSAASATSALSALVRSSLDTIDTQAKLAQSLATTTESVQVLTRAADLSGSSFFQLEAGSARLTRRLSLFAADGSGPAADAIRRLGLNAADLLALPLDQRIARVTEAIRQNAAASEQAALFSQLFGDRGFVAFQRLDAATLRQATQDVRDFGVAVSDADADQIEVTNDAISRLSLVATGLGNRVAVNVAPALQRMADNLASVSRQGGALQVVVDGLAGNLDRLLRAAGLVASLFAGRWVVAAASAAASARGVATALVLVQRALRLTGFGLLIAVLERVIQRFDELNATLSDDARRGFAALSKAVGTGISDLLRLVDATATAIVRLLELLGILERPVRLQLGDAVAELRDVQDRLRRIAQGQAGPGDQMARLELLRREAELLALVRELEDRRRRLASAATAPPPAPLAPAAITPAAIADRAAGGGAFGGGAGGGTSDTGTSDTGTSRSRPSASDPFFQAQAEGLAKSRRAAESLTRSLTGPFSEALKRGDLSIRGFANATVQALNSLSARIIENAFRPLEKFLAGFVQRLISGASGGGGDGGGGIFGTIVKTVIGAAAGSFGGAGAASSSTFASTSASLGTQGLFDASGSIILPFARGGVVDRLGKISAFADGGVIERPSLFAMRGGLGLAGEAGKEAILPLRRGRGGRLGVETASAAPELRQNVVIVDERDSIGRFIGSPEGERALVVTLERAGFRRG